MATAGTLVIACGALAKEIIALRQMGGWEHLHIQCLPAELHNYPDKIPGAVKEKIDSNRDKFDSIYVAYADCGTGGLLDKLLQAEQIERLPGAHCYEFFATSSAFASLAEREVGTFYLTDFLVKHFDRLVIRGLGLDKHPELMQSYFGNYKKLVYLAQTESALQRSLAEQAAQRLGLRYEYWFTGYGDLERGLKAAAEHKVVVWQN